LLASLLRAIEQLLAGIGHEVELCRTTGTNALPRQRPRDHVIAGHPAAQPALEHCSQQWQRQARTARRLSWLSLAYMAAEGAIAVTAAALAGSVALFGFGVDAVIEALASIIVCGSPALAPCPRPPSAAPRRRSASPSSCSRPTSPPTPSAPSSPQSTRNHLAGRGRVWRATTLGWWWLDPAVALGIAAMAIHEDREPGRRGRRGILIPGPPEAPEPSGFANPGT
jgi:hypothetical protein